jgi:hypothetical protein
MYLFLKMYHIIHFKWYNVTIHSLVVLYKPDFFLKKNHIPKRAKES